MMLNRTTIIIIAALLLCISSVAQDKVNYFRYLVNKFYMQKGDAL